MKRFIVALALSIASIAAIAAPSPKQVEAALASRDYNNARTMISQVLAEHPTSARGHLLNAYVLAAVDRNKTAAKNELELVRSLDKKGDVVSSPLFGRTVAAIDAIQTEAAIQQKQIATPMPAAPVVVVPVAQPTPTSSGVSGTTFLVVMLLIIAATAAVVWYINRRQKAVSESSLYSAPTPREPSPAPERRERREQPARKYSYVSPPPSPPAVRATRQTPSMYDNSGYGMTQSGYGAPNGMSGAMAGGVVVGVAGAMIVDNAVENAALRNRVSDLERERSNSFSSSSPIPAPAPAPSVDSSIEAQSFSSSSSSSSSWDDSWKSSSSSSSSSSWDSGSSSSSFDSGSSSSDW